MRPIATARAVPFGDGTPASCIDHRLLARAVRGVGGGLVMGVSAVATVGLAGVAVTAAAAWLLNIAVASNPHLQARAPSGPGTLALAGYDQVQSSASFETKWARATANMQVSNVVQVPESAVTVARAAPVPLPRPRAVQVKHEVVPVQVAKLTEPAVLPSPVPLPPRRPPERAESVPLPRPHPSLLLASRSIQQPAAPQVAAPLPEPIVVEKRPAAQEEPKKLAALPPPAEKAVTAPDKPKAPAARSEDRKKPAEAAPKAPLPKIQEAHNKVFALPGVDDHTAVYDISARTVYLPNGQKLEAHSGLGEKMDDPRYVHVRMRGATPPNVYDLTLRERLFHGVQAIRLNPINEDRMFGRDGILAHTYMLGSNGQSNGCVSFKDYDKFLHAFLKGEVDRMVVVASLGRETPRVANARRGDGWYSASND